MVDSHYSMWKQTAIVAIAFLSPMQLEQVFILSTLLLRLRSPLSSSLLFFKIYLFKRRSDREEEGYPFCWFTSKMTAVVSAWPVQCQEPEAPKESPTWWWGGDCASICRSPRHNSGELYWKQGSQDSNRDSDMWWDLVSWATILVPPC